MDSPDRPPGHIFAAEKKTKVIAPIPLIFPKPKPQPDDLLPIKYSRMTSQVSQTEELLTPERLRLKAKG